MVTQRPSTDAGRIAMPPAVIAQRYRPHVSLLSTYGTASVWIGHWLSKAGGSCTPPTGSRDIEHIGSAHDGAALEALKIVARRRLAAGLRSSSRSWANAVASVGPHAGRMREQLYVQSITVVADDLWDAFVGAGVWPTCGHVRRDGREHRCAYPPVPLRSPDHR